MRNEMLYACARNDSFHFVSIISYLEWRLTDKHNSGILLDDLAVTLV